MGKECWCSGVVGLSRKVPAKTPRSRSVHLRHRGLGRRQAMQTVTPFSPTPLPTSFGDISALPLKKTRYIPPLTRYHGRSRCWCARGGASRRNRRRSCCRRGRCYSNPSPQGLLDTARGPLCRRESAVSYLPNPCRRNSELTATRRTGPSPSPAPTTPSRPSSTRPTSLAARAPTETSAPATYTSSTSRHKPRPRPPNPNMPSKNPSPSKTPAPASSSCPSPGPNTPPAPAAST